MKSFGKYILFLGRMFENRERFVIYLKRFFEDASNIGLGSIVIVSIVSIFVGAVVAVQTAYNLINPLYPIWLIGLITRDMTILEIAPTFTAIVFAGKVGSSIAGSLGTMKITEQVDALEVMGINSISYLILPKIAAAVLMFPLLVTLSAFLGILGGFLASVLGGHLTAEQYVYGIRIDFQQFNILFMLIKSVVFGFLVSSISAYKGYFTSGGALEVGTSSTQAVTNSCIAVLIADFFLAQLLV